MTYSMKLPGNDLNVMYYDNLMSKVGYAGARQIFKQGTKGIKHVDAHER
jgi:uncharacterized protein YqgQ